MKPILLILSFLMFSYGAVTAQNQDKLNGDKKYSIHFRTGQNQIKETELLPLVHKGVILELSLETEKIQNSLGHFEFYFTYSRLKTSLEEWSKSANLRLGLNYSYNFPVIQNDHFRYYAGPQISWCYSFMLYPNWDESHSYWANHLSLEASNILSVSLKNENEWFSSLNFSLLSYFSRPEELRQFKMDEYTPEGMLRAFSSNPVMGSLPRVLHINYRTEYRFSVLGNKREAITFTLDFLRMSRNGDKPVFQIIKQFGIKIML